jgi:GNAT superfamily N-acetyltransferase
LTTKHEGRRVEKLARFHGVDSFDCGRQQLNLFFSRFAFADQQAGASQTYVGVEGDTILGFYSLAYGQVTTMESPHRVARGLARHPIPIMLLARLAVDVRWQGRGVGAGLLKDAMLRTLQAAEIAGIRALVVHAKDDAARRFYERYDFEPSPADPLHLFVLLKDVRRLIGKP